jgi:hypothetical protein
MKAWIAGSVAAWMIAASGLAMLSWWGLSPLERATLRPEAEAELGAAMPPPVLFGHPLFRVWIAALWSDPDRRVRWHTLPAGAVRQALHPYFPTPLLVLADRIAVIAGLQALLASLILWAAIRAACGGTGGAAGTPVVPLGRPPRGR